MYSSSKRISSNFARDQKMNKVKDLPSLGEEPTVDLRKTFTLDKIKLGSLTRNKHQRKNNILVKQRKCPDESLYEDLVENIRVEPEIILDNSNQERCSEPSQDLNESKPFHRLENCLFSCFTSCLPWCLMRRIYWNNKK